MSRSSIEVNDSELELILTCVRSYRRELARHEVRRATQQKWHEEEDAARELVRLTRKLEGFLSSSRESRSYEIVDAAVVAEDGGSDAAYDLLNIKSKNAMKMGQFIGEQLQIQDLTNTEPGSPLTLTLAIRIDRKPHD